MGCPRFPAVLFTKGSYYKNKKGEARREQLGSKHEQQQALEHNKQESQKTTEINLKFKMRLKGGKKPSLLNLLYDHNLLYY